ncbi:MULTISPECIES: DUF1304 domain-containing protein [Arthrobacter]|uniref:DUF1304 domain-containing protein n=1 Tax=Arthrobacter TaxID=1663 RepID=UPI000833900F|nr:MULTISPECIES: DUF1304 domain-containing protein [Arthrobacter]UPO78056.1 DUF1304 domain-containing protein [Arthrobacter sp. Helios]
MLVAASVFALIAAAIHVYIFVLESIRWMAPATRTLFGISSDEQADHTRPLAYNQGFYNLFLATGTVIGVILLGLGNVVVGATMIVFAASSMALAGLVLLLSDPRMLRPALIQAVPAVLALVFVIAGL